MTLENVSKTQCPQSPHAYEIVALVLHNVRRTFHNGNQLESCVQCSMRASTCHLHVVSVCLCEALKEQSMNCLGNNHCKKKMQLFLLIEKRQTIVETEVVCHELLNCSDRLSLTTKPALDPYKAFSRAL